MFRISNRKITKSEAELVVRKIKLTPNIMGYSLIEWIRADHIIVAEDENGNIAGVCLNYDFHQDWNKIAALFVFEEFRGMGLGKLLFYKSCEDALKRGKNVYTISANEIVINMMKDLDFSISDSLTNLPKVTNIKYKLAFYSHHIVWIMNFYRLQEIIRKIIVYKYQKKFIYGIKLFNS
ncbi:GNAT family N-acetyltransferase [Cronbergia sp. UHCC 0137]|uniref:GNAT family N-acetyltransferase n=1 Tax=Cronbergia sp. UHCC 0137 TaxID=3110239 RepID=UPI002B1FBBDA|nr:GNAT family N-acetyltransferase [Cronbergia sp. UHCC 0137]MEA5618049.1 GNAT family N-acetyltransferase [Cronbergia sp. UHCC 0137]